MVKFLTCFQAGSNRDSAMMEHIVGRKNLEGVSAILKGYELCVMKTKHFPDKKYPNAILAPDISARDLMRKHWGDDFEMHMIRKSKKNPNNIMKGIIRKLTPKEYEYIRVWEMMDMGVQEDIIVAVEDENDKMVIAITSGWEDPDRSCDRVLNGANYENYVVTKQAMLDKADEVRGLVDKKMTEISETRRKRLIEIRNQRAIDLNKKCKALQKKFDKELNSKKK